eukprot:TRINITY_DN32743_c0_g1_i1.p1 TRINITY_DN32743_c0_g1~~TRINITY_DN32743_c0_g1_i1.p1  ORF type:complete len:1038 (+),score=270.72 TRINITY_DN32743_c0_g1_i1:156-3269(+)
MEDALHTWGVRGKVETLAVMIETAASAPMAQEFSLLCFFCLGFLMFRTEAVKGFLGSRSQSKKFAQTSAPGTCSPQHLQELLAAQKYEQVLDSWPMLDDFTAEALSTVVTALLAVDRADDVGLFIAKTIVNLPHLRPCVDKAIDAISAPSCQVPQHRIAVALQDVYGQNSNALDTKASLALLVGFARVNDLKHVGEMLKRLKNKGETAPPEVLERVIFGFLECNNIDAAFCHLRKALALHGDQRNLQALLVQVAHAVEAADESGSRMHDLLSIMEGSGCQPVEVLAKIFRSAARRSPCDTALANRAADKLRSSPNIGALPFNILEALLQADILAGASKKASELFSEVVRVHSDLPDKVLLGLISSCESRKNSSLTEQIYSWVKAQKRCTQQLAVAFLKAFAAANQTGRAFAIFKEAVADGVKFEQSVCSQVAGLVGKQPEAVQDALKKSASEGLANPSEPETQESLNASLKDLVSAGDHAAAHQLFNKMREEKRLSVAAYNILLKLYVGKPGEVEEVKAIFEEMLQDNFCPSSVTYNSIVCGALSQGNFDFVWQILSTMERQGPGIDCYVMCNIFKGIKSQRGAGPHFDRALKLLDRHFMQVDDVLACCIFEVCVSLRDPKRMIAAQAAVKRLAGDKCSSPAMHTTITMIKAWAACNQMSKAVCLWNEFSKHQVPDGQMYSQMIEVFMSGGLDEEALKLLEEMKSSLSAERGEWFTAAYAALIRGFMQQKDPARAMEMFEEMKELKVPIGIVVLNTMIDACCRQGDMQRASGILSDMANFQAVPDLITYSTLIKGYCVQGDLDNALQLFGVMKRRGIQPDAIVFNSLLDGCARRAMPSLCEQVVNDMVEAGIKPSNYSVSILIKLYGRVADLDAAFKVLDEMPKKYGFIPNPAVYTTLMSSCTWNHRMDLAMELRLRMIKDGQLPDEKTYSTLLRGALRTGNCEAVCTLLSEALEQEKAPGQSGKPCRRHLLDREVIQNGLNLIHRRRQWGQRGGDDLVSRLAAAGYSISPPDASEARDARASGRNARLTRPQQSRQ